MSFLPKSGLFEEDLLLLERASTLSLEQYYTEEGLLTLEWNFGRNICRMYLKAKA